MESENPSGNPVTSDPDGLSPPRLSSDELFAGTRKILIRHGATDYFLTITKQGKLILTK